MLGGGRGSAFTVREELRSHIVELSVRFARFAGGSVMVVKGLMSRRVLDMSRVDVLSLLVDASWGSPGDGRFESVSGDLAERETIPESGASSPLIFAV